jgi:hypothetical protein
VRLRKGIYLAAGLVLLACGASASAKPARAASAVEAAAICKTLIEDPAQVKAALQRAGWKDATPSMGGTSMASITGSSQYRRSGDVALVSTPASMVGPNCEFSLNGFSDTDYAEAMRGLSEAFASQPQTQSDGMVWTTGAASIFVRRKGQSLTILWLPKSKDPK